LTVRRGDIFQAENGSRAESGRNELLPGIMKKQ